MEPLTDIIKLIETISVAEHALAKHLRIKLIDLLDSTRNQNGQSPVIVKYTFVLDVKTLHVKIDFANSGVFETFGITLDKMDFLKHLYFNGDATLINQDITRVDDKQTFMGVRSTEVSQYIDDICGGRIAYKLASFKLN